MESRIRRVIDDASPRSRTAGKLNVGTMASGAPIDINYVVLKGREDGPCLWVVGQVHGVELNGVIATLDFANSLDVSRLRGTVVVTASANPLALDGRRKAAPQDDYDLDQTYPGREAGFTTERMAATLFPEVAACADLVVNMHTNSPAFDAKPYTVYKQPPDERVSAQELLRLQAGFEPSVCCRMNIKPGNGELLGNISGALDYQLLQAGIPAFMVELGGGQRADADHIRQGVVGLRRVAARMGMISGDDCRLDAAPSTVRHVTRRGHLTFNHGGLFRSGCLPGEVVSAGEPLGQVMNLFGETVEEMALPYEAVIICIRRDPVVHTGDRFIYVAQDWSRVDVAG